MRSWLQLWACGVDGPREPVIPRQGLLHGTLARFTASQQIVSRLSAGPDAHRFDRLVRHTAKAAALLYTLFALNVQSAFAQDGHHRFHDYYQHWKQPGTTVSCCNARMNVMGVEMGDCEPTRAEIRQGDRYAWERLTQRWLKIPDDRILKERNPSVEEGHLCFNKWTGQILCFVPPDTGG